jgi:hypothetical protein
VFFTLAVVAVEHGYLQIILLEQVLLVAVMVVQIQHQLEQPLLQIQVLVEAVQVTLTVEVKVAATVAPALSSSVTQQQHLPL